MNDESAISCSNCGLMRGSVVIQGASDGPIGTESIPLDRPAPGPSAPATSPAPATPTAQNAPDAPRAADALPRAAAGGPPGAVPGWVAPSGEPAPTPPSVPLWRRIPLGGLLFAVLIIGGGISSWYFGAGRSDTGEIAKPGDLGANKLRVGDCYDLKDPQASEIEDVAAKPCTDAHEYELYFTGSMGEGAYPAEAVFEQYVLDNCDPAFATYVGKTYQESTLDIYWLIPTDASWRSGDRTVQCAVFDPKIARLTTSLKGANR
jgi:hypothetical protein